MQLVHRDVSPQNIFVTYDGQVKVLDFGIAKIASSSSHTTAGLVKGKIAYMAPGQMRGEAVDRRADIYSAGCLLWAIAARQKLWKDVPDIKIMRRVVLGDVPSPRTVDPECAEELVRIIAKALAPSREDRYATALELQTDLEQYCENSGSIATQKGIGGSVLKLFADSRAELKAHLERQLAHLVDDCGDFAELEAIHETGDLTADSSTTNGDPTGLGVSVQIGTGRRRSHTAVAVLLALAGVASVGVYAGRYRQRLPEPSASLQDAPKTVEPLVERPAPNPAPRVPAAVTIDFRVTPPGAALFVDGRALTGGVTSHTFTADASMHLFRAEAAGYQPFERELGLSHDQIVDVSLSRIIDRSTKAATAGRSPAPRAPGKPASVPTSAKPDCEDPFVVDANRIKRMRPECL
jgi:hypothetical protein